MTDRVLVADIGGTNARFALADASNDMVALSAVKNFRAEEFKTLREAAEAYLGSVAERPARACFAVAGPVTDERIEFTNSPWVLDITEMKTALSLKTFSVVNDFQALAAGVRSLGADDFLALRTGPGDAQAPVLVIGPGTGLGQALIVPFGTGRRVVPTEGGHVGFAPRTEEEAAVNRFIAKEYSRVSVERLLSGPGIVNIYNALCAINGAKPLLLQADEITAAALCGADAVAVKTVNMFCAVLGDVSGDGVLATGARGGVVLGGGILPKIRDVFLKSDFADRFMDKGRMRHYCEDVPVRMIIRDGAALTGAAAFLLDFGHAK